MTSSCCLPRDGPCSIVMPHSALCDTRVRLEDAANGRIAHHVSCAVRHVHGGSSRRAPGRTCQNNLLWMLARPRSRAAEAVCLCALGAWWEMFSIQSYDDKKNEEFKFSSAVAALP